jgi:LacI family transcriptional regulator
MHKAQKVFEAAVKDIRTSTTGNIGERYLSLREFCARYGVAYMTAVKVLEALRAENYIALKNRAHYINDCDAGKPRFEKTLVGVHVRDISNSFYATLCANLVKAANKRGIELIIMSSRNDNARKKDILKRFIELNCKGVINLNSYDDIGLSGFYKLYPLPFVMCGADPIPGVRTDFIITDNRRSGMQAAKHLLEIGARMFYYVKVEGPPETGDERRAGFRDYLASAGISEYSVTELSSEEGGIEGYDYFATQLQAAAKKGKLGIFCHHDLLAMTVLKLCAKKRISVPDNAAVIGYDDLPAAKQALPALTSFSYSFAAIAEKCVAALLGRMADNSQASSTIVFPTALMIRDSTKNNPVSVM